MQQARILIIGAGLAGLSLGQGLKQAGIPFRIFERDGAASFRAQGYRIRIDQRGAEGLRRLLPAELYQAFESTSSDVIHGGQQLDAATGKQFENVQSRMPPKQGQAWNVDRTVIRNVLLTGLREHIDFGKKFLKYELVDEGVVAHFSNGLTAQGSMIIGADGIRSPVRRQMLPNNVLLDTEGRAVFGKTVIDADTFKSIPEEIGNGISMAWTQDEPRIKLFCDVMRFDRTGKLPSTSQVELPQDYIYWVLLFNKVCNNKSDEELAALTNEESANFAKQLASGWHERIRNIVHKQVPEAASTLFFLLSQAPLETWEPDTRVTLMGDSFHPMPPVGGTGANIAFADAADLLDMIKAGVTKEGLARCEEFMRERSNTALKMVAGGAGHFIGMKPVKDLKPVDFS